MRFKTTYFLQKLKIYNMKKTLFLLIFNIFLQNVHAQFPTFKDNPTWKVVDYTSGTIQLATIKTWQFSGETTICNQMYSKISANNNIWFLRKDGNKTYIRWTIDCKEKEFLLYDFDMKVGDIRWVKGYLMPDSMKIKLLSIDKVLYNNTLQNIFNLEYTYPFGPQKAVPLRWISNIGSPERSPLYFLSCFPQLVDGYGFALACMSQNGNLIYENPKFPDCKLVAANDISNFEKINIFPNPFQNYITIRSENESKKTIELFDCQGISILRDNFKNEIIIDTENLKSGIYFVKIKNENRVKAVYKITKLN